MDKKNRLLAFAITLAAHPAAQASDFTLQGFATLGVSTLDQDGVAYKSVDNKPRADFDSIAGLQLSIPINDQMQFTSQVVGRGTDDYNAEMEWAFARYELNEFVDIRAGRLRIPFFAISDTLEVGYAYPWIRPPVDVYGQLGFTRFEGVDAIYRNSVGSAAISVQPFAGASSPQQEVLGQTVDLDITRLWGLNVLVQWEYVQLRLGRTEGDYSISGMESMMAGFSLPPGMALPDQLNGTDRHGAFTGIGLSGNLDNFLWFTEYTERETDGLISDSSGWYATIAYQIQRWQPHLTVSRLKTEEDYQDLEAMQAMPDIPAEMAGMLGAIINEGKVDQDSLTLGARYDFLPHAALKFEWQQVDVKAGNGLFDADTEIDDTVNLYSIAMDVTF